MELTKESKKIFKKTLKKVIKELDELKRLSKDNIEIPLLLKSLKQDYWHLFLSQNEFTIYTPAAGFFNLEHKVVNFAKKNKFGRYVIPEEDFGTYSTKILIAFLEEYPEVRKNVAKAIELKEEARLIEDKRKKDDQEKTFERLREIQSICSSLATIEIQMPQTNNQHEIEIKEECGQKIGTIKINGLTLRIITSGDVKITNDLKEGKVKAK